MNKEELLKEYDEKAKALRNEFISKLDDKKEFKLSNPEDNEIVYYVSSLDGKITQTWYRKENNYDLRKFEQSQYFETYEEAEQYLKERKLLFKLHQYAKEKNEGWVPDWDNGMENKYYIYYSSDRKKLFVGTIFWGNEFNKLPLFKTKELARECIDLFGDEIIEVLC